MAASRGKNPTFDVFVGNLPPDANEKNVGKLFTPYGEIAGITVRESNKAKGPNKFYAFVKYLCEPDADKACSELDRMNLNGTPIAVKRADKERQRVHFDGKKNTRAQDSESSDSVGGPVQASDNIPLAEHETVMITHVENPITLWLQVVNDENTAKIFSITEQLATLCPTASPVKGLPEPGKTYASLFAEDNMWYRCKIKQTLGTDKYKIQYIDYGNTEEVSLRNLVEIPLSVGNLKGMAIKLTLHNIKSKDLTDKQAIQFLRTITDNQMASFEKIRPLADGTGAYGHLFVNNQSVGEAMVKAGYCLHRPGLGKMAGHNRQQMDEPADASNAQMMDMFAGDKNRDHNTSSAFQLMVSGQPDVSREKELQNELMRKRKEVDKLRSDKDQTTNQLRRELDKMRNDRDQVSIQLEYMKTKVKTLQEEFTVSAAKLQEDTMSKRIETLVTLSQVTRRLRDQFPTDNNKTCLLEKAIDVCTSADRVDNSKCTTLQAVGSALAKYKAAQDEISQCKQQSEIDEIVMSRDEARRELHDSLEACLTELSSLPLEERSKLVQDLQMKLTHLYGEYLKLQIHDCPKIENVSAGFKTWKIKKDMEFTDVRTVTNFSDKALQAALAQIQQRISIDSGLRSDLPQVDIDELMKTYTYALQREISVTDLIRSKDANLVANVISSVIRELQTESTTLENFQVLKGEFRSRQESLAPWLEDKPTFTELQENRKLLRSLRSKLRHKLADKLDLEESGSEGELDTIKEEEEKIRSELQAALVRSDTLIHEIAALADSNFPELIIQYPDLAIDQFLIYKGLVKSNREMDHYTTTPGFRPGTHLSTFNEKPVLIQEFLLDQTTKDEFIKRVTNYPGETFKVQAVFFSKNERQVYLESAWDKKAELIEVFIKECVPTPHGVQQICLQLAQEVANLHKHGCIHGEISTQSVLLTNDKQVVLLCPDFCKTVQERVNKKVSTENGLVFQCPDLQYTTADMVGPAADIYNLVLLMFWLHGPKHSNGSSDGHVQDLDPSLQALFDAVLRGKSAGRLSAEQVVQIDYFRRTLPDSFDPPPQVVGSPPPPLIGDPLNITPESPNTSTPQTPPQTPVIKSMDEPMEIGVFQVENFSNLIKEDIQPSGVETDDSWTTKSSSSGSRVESPLENGVTEEATASGSDVTGTADTKSDTSRSDTANSNMPESVDAIQTDNVQSGTDPKHTNESEVKSEGSNKIGETENIEKEFDKLDVKEEKYSDVSDVSVEAVANGDIVHAVTPAGDNLAEAVGDVFSQATNSDYLKEERKSLGQILSQSSSPTSFLQEGERVVEKETLKSLLSNSKSFLMNSYRSSDVTE